jgi:hypothetical protein
MRGLLCVLALLATAAAQAAPPSIIAVTDENGVAVSSAIVFLESGSGRTLRCPTDYTGRCQFPALPAGAYQLRVQKEGFYELREPHVEIIPGETIDVAISHQQEVREVVNVEESPPTIDPAQVASKETLTGVDVIDMLYPDEHDYRNVLNFIPGVVQDQGGQPHVAGAETYQTLTLLDGFNVTQPANGQLLIRVSTDAFRSIQVEPSREPAEYGKGSAGVLALNTGIGDDHFRFWATDFIPSVQNKHGIRFDQFLPRFTFSGPIKKGKAWFYNAADGEYDNLVFTELPAGQDNDHILRWGDLFKVQTNVTARDILTTSFLVNALNNQFAFFSPQMPQFTNPKDLESAYAASIKDQHYFAGKELLEAGFAFNQYNMRLTPYGNSPYWANTGTASVLGITGGSYYLSDQTHARRWQALANVFFPSQQWHGSHDFKIGVDLDRISYDADYTRQPISFLSGNDQGNPAGNECFTAPRDKNFPCTRYSSFGPAPLHTQYNAEISGYVEDRWSVTNRLLIEPGLRLDWDEIVRQAAVGPRLAGTYVLDNSGNTKLSAGIGMVNDETPIFLIARPYAGSRQDTFFTVNPRCPSGSTACVTTTGPVTTTFTESNSALEMPRFVNWSVGIEKKLPAAIYVKAEFLEKRGTRGFVYNTLGATTGGDFLLQNTRDDRYDAFQISLKHSFREGYSLMGSYTRSSARSNQVLDFNVDNPLLSGQQPGPYPWDVPNRFLSWGYIPFFKLPILHQTELAYSMEARSGFVFNLLNPQQQLLGKADTGRYPEYFTLNVQLEKRFHLLGYYLALRGGFDNITGRCDPFVVDNIIDPVNHPSPTFSACLGRAFTSRIRLLGRK